YECLAKNGGSSDKCSLRFNESFRVQQKDKREVGWEMMSIAGACSFVAGILFVYILNCLGKKCTTRDDRNDNSEHVDVSPESRQQRSGNEELGPNEMELRHTSRRPEDEEIRHSATYVNVMPVNVENMPDYVNYDENSYQDLNELRERDEDRYQSLNEINI
ncbi:Hypothetical predicted protein, partial [Paramuricea clavata]